MLRKVERQQKYNEEKIPLRQDKAGRQTGKTPQRSLNCLQQRGSQDDTAWRTADKKSCDQLGNASLFFFFSFFFMFGWGGV
jgi:hypothetical protein